MIKKAKTKRIEPQWIYNKDKKPTHVYLTIEDFNRFIEKIKETAQTARKLVAENKKKGIKFPFETK